MGNNNNPFTASPKGCIYQSNEPILIIKLLILFGIIVLGVGVWWSEVQLTNALEENHALLQEAKRENILNRQMLEGLLRNQENNFEVKLKKTEMRLKKRDFKAGLPIPLDE